MVSAGLFEVKDDLDQCSCHGRKKNRGHCQVLEDDGATWPVPARGEDLQEWDEYDKMMRMEEARLRDYAQAQRAWEERQTQREWEQRWEQHAVQCEDQGQ